MIKMTGQDVRFLSPCTDRIGQPDCIAMEQWQQRTAIVVDKNSGDKWNLEHVLQISHRSYKIQPHKLQIKSDQNL